VFRGIINKPPIYETFTVTFMEQPVLTPVDTCEVKCLGNRNAHINIQSMILPRVKQLLYSLQCSVIFLFQFADLF